MTKEAGRSTARLYGEGGDPFIGVILELDTEERRWSEGLLAGDRPSAMTFDTETEVEAGVTEGPLEAELLRRGDTDASRSTFLRFGEECNECGPSERLSALWRRWFCSCSMVDAVGTELDTAAVLQLRERLTPSDECTCFGLPVRGLPVTEDDVLPDRDDDLDGLEPLDLRSVGGMVAFRLLFRPTPAEVGIGLPLVPKLSKAAFISGGIGTWCTILTDLQSCSTRNH